MEEKYVAGNTRRRNHVESKIRNTMMGNILKGIKIR